MVRTGWRTARHALGVFCLICLGAVAARADTVPADDRWLEPVYTVSGGFLTAGSDPTGMPLPDGRQTYVNFMAPVAVAERNGELFIADAGRGRLFRYVRGSALMTAVPGIVVTATTRLRTSTDGTIFLLDAFSGTIVRYSPYRHNLPALNNARSLSRYQDFDVMALTGQIVALDALTRRVELIDPTGQFAVRMLDLDATGPLALYGSAVAVASAACACVTLWRDGSRVGVLAQGDLRLPKAMVAQQEILFVLDGFDRSLFRLSDGMTGKLPLTPLGVVMPEQFSISGHLLYLADSGARRVAVFRIRALR